MLLLCGPMFISQREDILLYFAQRTHCHCSDWDCPKKAKFVTEVTVLLTPLNSTLCVKCSTPGHIIWWMSCLVSLLQLSFLFCHCLMKTMLKKKQYGAKVLNCFPSNHRSIYFLPLIRGGVRQQVQEGNPDIPLPSDTLQLLQRDPEAFPGQKLHIIPPTCPESPPSRTCPENLQTEATRRHPNQMAEPPQLIPFNAEFYLLKNCNSIPHLSRILVIKVHVHFLKTWICFGEYWEFSQCPNILYYTVTCS